MGTIIWEILQSGLMLAGVLTGFYHLKFGVTNTYGKANAVAEELQKDHARFMELTRTVTRLCDNEVIIIGNHNKLVDKVDAHLEHHRREGR